MAAPNKNYKLKISQTIIEFPDIGLNNLNFIEGRKSHFLNVHSVTP
jgi:hypothetical protein